MVVGLFGAGFPFVDGSATAFGFDEVLGGDLLGEHATELRLGAISKKLMQQTDITFYPNPENWTVALCRQWCADNEKDFMSDPEDCHRDFLTLWLLDVIQYGSDSILKRICGRSCFDS